MHDTFSKFGHALAWGFIGAGTLGNFLADHAMQVLTGGALIVGTACQVYTTILKDREHRAKFRGQHDGQSPTVNGKG